MQKQKRIRTSLNCIRALTEWELVAAAAAAAAPVDVVVVAPETVVVAEVDVLLELLELFKNELA